MIKILDKEYSHIQPVMPEKNAVAIFSIESAKIAFNHSRIDFVIALNGSTGKFAYCHSVKDVEEFLNKK